MLPGKRRREASGKHGNTVPKMSLAACRQHFAFANTNSGADAPPDFRAADQRIARFRNRDSVAPWSIEESEVCFSRSGHASIASKPAPNERRHRPRPRAIPIHAAPTVPPRAARCGAYRISVAPPPICQRCRPRRRHCIWLARAAMGSPSSSLNSNTRPSAIMGTGLRGVRICRGCCRASLCPLYPQKRTSGAHSSTLSARASIVGGVVNPSVLRLSSVGCSFDD
jgi:hypothetical protein